MSEPAPELDEEDARRGVMNQLMVDGESMSVIIPRSVIETLGVLAALLASERTARALPSLLLQAMPWASSLSDDDLRGFASELADAVASGEHAPERLSALMRGWRETAEILADPEAMAELAESADDVARGDVIRGRDALRALRPRR